MKPNQPTKGDEKMTTINRLYHDSKRMAMYYALNATALWGGEWTYGKDSKGWFSMKVSK